VADLRLNLGSGNAPRPGWVNVDIDGTKSPDVVADVRALPAELTDADEAMAIHVVEHFATAELIPLLTHWHRRLRRGARLVVECPDLAGYAAAYAAGTIGAADFNKMAYERVGVGEARHKALIDGPLLRSALLVAGFHGIVERTAQTHGRRAELNLRMEAFA